MAARQGQEADGSVKRAWCWPRASPGREELARFDRLAVAAMVVVAPVLELGVDQGGLVWKRDAGVEEEEGVDALVGVLQPA